MARPKKDTEKQDSIAPEQISKNLLGALLNGYKDDHYNFVESTPVPISTGSLILDSLISLKSSSTVRLCSSSELGKTSASLLIAKNYMDALPKARTLFIKAEGRLGDEIKRRSELKFVYTAEEWDYKTVFVYECNIFETVATVIEKMLKTTHENGEHLCICIDSLDGLILKKDLEDKEIEEGVMVAGVPKMTKLLFRRIALPISKFNALLLIISQVSANIQLNPYSKNEQPRMISGVGGAAALHACDYILEFMPRYQKDLILEDPTKKPDPIENRILGHWVKVDIKKSATNNSHYTCSYPVKHSKTGNCVWTEIEVAHLMMGWGLLSREGGKDKGSLDLDQGVYDELKAMDDKIPIKFRTLNHVYEYLETRPDITVFLRDKFKKMIST